MVSVAGYTVAEYVMMIVASYVLLLFALISRYMVDVVEGRSLARTTIIFAIILITIVVLYNTKVRFGTVMLFNGIAVTYAFMNVANVWRARKWF